MKMLKKRKSVLISLVFCLAFLLLFSQAALAEDGVKLNASSEAGSEGEEVSVTISIENATGSSGGQFELTFDPDVAVPVDIAKGSFVDDADNGSINYNLEFSDNSLMVIWVTPYGDTADSGVVCTIDFELLEEGDSSLIISGVVISPVEMEVATTHGTGSIAVDDLSPLEKAIIAANEAIAALPAPDDITLDVKADVENARDLVMAAKELGAEEDDFDDLAKLVAAEAMIAMLNAIKAACDAILALPAVEDLTIDQNVKDSVIYARYLVTQAMVVHGATEADFNELCGDVLNKLRAAENRIRELEGLVPTPPTGGLNYLLFPGLFVMVVGMLLYTKRKRFAVR